MTPCAEALLDEPGASRPAAGRRSDLLDAASLAAMKCRPEMACAFLDADSSVLTLAFDGLCATGDRHATPHAEAGRARPPTVRSWATWSRNSRETLPGSGIAGVPVRNRAGRAWR
ncbi:hypothetical protein ACRAWF_20515 [Streptomyces sp. L7]